MQIRTQTLLFFLILIASGCAGFSKQPAFIDIAGEDAQAVKIIKTVQTKENMIHIFFSDKAILLSADIFMPQTGEIQACAFKMLNEDEKEKTDAAANTGIDTSTSTNSNAAVNTNFPEDAEKYSTDFILTPSYKIGIGEPFVVRGSVSDLKHSVLDFALPFEGVNTHPAKLKITEIRPLYSSKPKSEFIEFIVEKSGNLAGITITNVGDKKNPHYAFPPADVTEGEVIVYHWRSVEDNIRDEHTTHIISGGTQSCPAARDFWGPYTSLPKRNANVILIKTEMNGGIQDAVLYCTEKEFTKRKPHLTWNNEALAEDAKTAVAGGAWHGEPALKGAIIAPITASKSLVRNAHARVNKADIWTIRAAKKVTMGKAY